MTDAIQLIVIQAVIIVATAFIVRHKSARERHDAMYVVYAIAATFDAIMVISWLWTQATLGQYPSFSLVPFIAACIILTALALRSRKLYHKQGNGPA